jgi:hypothetical protein
MSRLCVLLLRSECAKATRRREHREPARRPPERDKSGLAQARAFRLAQAHRLLRSTSAFLQATLEKRRPTPLIDVRANMTLTLPSRLVLSTRRMCWKLDSFMMSDMPAPALLRPRRKSSALQCLARGLTVKC